MDRKSFDAAARERIEFVVDMACMAGFESLANVFLAQLRSVPNRRNHGHDVVRSIVRSPPYEPICKLLNSDPDFQAYIATGAQAIAQREIRKLTLNAALRLPTKAVDPTRLETFNMVAVDKEHRREAPFLQSLLRVIIDSSDAVNADPSGDLDQELPELDDNQTFLLLEAKTSTRRDKPMIAVVVLCVDVSH